MDSNLALQSEHRMFDGWHKKYQHQAASLNCDMTFSIYLPPQVEEGESVPVVYWLSGLTCNDDNFSHKAGAQRWAAELGIALVIPDTSPRGEGVADDPDGAYDMGLGAGFYINATQAPWQQHYQMYDYITQELPDLIESHFQVTQQRAISGHSMGGHGALIIGLKNAERYSSISAFSPIVNPSVCPWGEKVFSHYLGDDQSTWQQYDSVALIQAGLGKGVAMRIDQGTEDTFLKEQLLTGNFIEACQDKDLTAEVNLCEGYDHSYFFIASFIEQHLRFHAQHFKLSANVS